MKQTKEKLAETMYNDWKEESRLQTEYVNSIIHQLDYDELLSIENSYESLGDWSFPIIFEMVRRTIPIIGIVGVAHTIMSVINNETN